MILLISKKIQFEESMIFNDYFSQILEGVEFLIAFGSIISLLALILGILMILAGYRTQVIKLIIISISIIAVYIQGLNI